MKWHVYILKEEAIKNAAAGGRSSASLEENATRFKQVIKQYEKPINIKFSLLMSNVYKTKTKK